MSKTECRRLTKDEIIAKATEDAGHELSTLEKRAAVAAAGVQFVCDGAEGDKLDGPRDYMNIRYNSLVEDVEIGPGGCVTIAAGWTRTGRVKRTFVATEKQIERLKAGKPIRVTERAFQRAAHRCRIG